MPPDDLSSPPASGTTSPPDGSTNAFDVVLAGFVGGVLAVLMRHIREFFTGGAVTSKFDTQVWIFVIGFGLLGALLVRIFREPNAGKAFVFGIALPSFLINLGAGVQNDPARKAEQSTEVKPASVEVQGGGLGLLSFFSPAAYAQGDAPWNVPGRTIEIVTVDESFAYHAELLDASGQKIKDIDVPISNSTLYRTDLPPEAAGIRFGTGDRAVVKSFINRTPGIVVGIALRVTFERSIGVAQLLGKETETQRRYSVDLEERDKAPEGLEGWVFLGNRDYRGWGLQTVDTGSKVPKAGDVVQTTVPVNVRDGARSKQPRLGIITSGQHVQLLTDPQGTGALWARVKVVPDP